MNAKSILRLSSVVLSLSMLLAACAPAATPGPTALPQPTTAPAATTAPTTAAITAATAAATVTTAAPTSAAPTNTVEPTWTPAPGKIQLSLWTHSAGNPTEIAADKGFIDAFNAASDKYQVVLQAFPQASYNDSVAAAAVAGSLPCIMDLDAPTVPNFAWSKYIQPIPASDADIAKLGVLPADMGVFQGKTYSLGQFDVALVIYARKSVLDKYQIRIPTMDQPWTKDEFTKILDTLKAGGEFQYPFDVNPGYTGEWWPYAYSPMLQSFGGDLIDRASYTTAEGALNGKAALAWGQWFQGLFTNKYVNPTPADDQGFLQGHVALWYTGSWSANDVVKKYGSDALFLPPVDLGNGPKMGAGSWQWGISAACKNPDGAWQFINYLLQAKQVAAMSVATGLIPTTQDAAALTDNYKEGGPYRVFYDMIKKYAVIRPPTPGYLIISSAFEQAGTKIRDGGDVQNTLDDAVDKINQDIKDHNNYGFGQ
jgi:multiple sugar transport system substrate-binding protein